MNRTHKKSSFIKESRSIFKKTTLVSESFSAERSVKFHPDSIRNQIRDSTEMLQNSATMIAEE